MTRINIRVDGDLKEKADELPNKLATNKQIKNRQARAEAEGDQVKTYDNVNDLLEALNE
ncbi:MULTISPECIES: hypothetical protein [Aerococcus]|uniref:Uncharacterized protein n=1 Tax=Aerococcus loyolae TaxID=2976809 RepID=A0ABT4BXV1_9LACT|nr:MULTISPECIES: hypothetical protein [Aerococcus]MCY3025080.1 hypothetical protein [Aerococcus loyolae]MCY3028016.1 hypothetical protein [Aerococcus loyolae]MCY3028448.1 hypothetical protein [Aerococcus loyolae]MDK6231680.1 hypothetical protein [Aerococcus urinae]MDK6258685.1 hypothetical protein [Aerococcus urinae]